MRRGAGQGNRGQSDGMGRRLIVVMLFLGGAILVWYLTRGELSLERLGERERQLRGLIEEQPWRTFAITFAIYALVSVFPGTSGKSVVVGWLFGFWPAFLMVMGALMIAGVVGFSVARYLVRDALREQFGLRLERFDRAFQREGAFYLLTVRLLHVPFTLVNYVSGVSVVGYPMFVWTTLVGLVPGTIVLVGLGAGLPSLDELLDQGVLVLVNPMVLASLLAMALVPWIVRWTVRKLRTGNGTGDSVDAGIAARGRSR